MTPDNPKLTLPSLPSLDVPGLQMPVFGQPNQRPQKKSMQASFLGSAATPSRANLGGKTLLGQ